MNMLVMNFSLYWIIFYSPTILFNLSVSCFKTGRARMTNSTLHVTCILYPGSLPVFFWIMSLLRHLILRQSLLRHLLLRQSLLLLLILRQWPIVFAILAHLAIQMQYRTAHLTWKGHGFYSRVGSFFQRGPTKYFLQKKILFHVDLIKMLSLISLFLRFPLYFPQNSG